MVEHEPKQVILEQLRSFENAPSDLASFIKENSSFWRPIKYKRSLPHGARMTTVKFLKERSIPGYQVHAVTFEDTSGLRWHLFCLVIQDTTGNWHVECCSGAGGNAALSHPQRVHPRVNLSGDWDDYFYAGGSVIDDSRVGIARVRLVSSEGQILEDIVQDNLVLFVTSQRVQMPMQVEFYNQPGELVGSYQTFDVTN